VPADSYPLALAPTHNIGADSINDSGDLMSRDARVLDAWEDAVLDYRVAMADTTRLDFDA